MLSCGYSLVIVLTVTGGRWQHDGAMAHRVLLAVPRCEVSESPDEHAVVCVAGSLLNMQHRALKVQEVCDLECWTNCTA